LSGKTPPSLARSESSESRTSADIRVRASPPPTIRQSGSRVREDLKPRRRESMKVLATLAVMGFFAVGSLVMSAAASAAPQCHGLAATLTGTSGPDHIVGTN